MLIIIFLDFKGPCANKIYSQCTISIAMKKHWHGGS
jgi:hypothetical protein